MSSVHGLNHLTQKSRHPIEILIWLIFIIGAIYGAVSLSFTTWQHYQENPTVISMERDRFSWNTSFPAATICPTFKLNELKVNKYIENSQVEDKEKLRNFITKLSEASFTTFKDVPYYDGFSSDQYMQLLLDLAFEFVPTVTNSGSSGRQYKIEQIITEMGICYSFNSQLAVYFSPEYRKADRWEILKRNETFFVHPLDGEVFANVVNMSTGISMYLHGPEEVVDVASKGLNSPNGYFLQIYLNGLTLFTSDAARQLTIAQRKCRFPYESNLPHSPVYSYTICRMECRLQMCKKLCGCIPHFYRKKDGDTVCDVKGLHCLGYYSVMLTTLVKNGEKLCHCVPNCDEVTYVIEDLDTREWFLGSNLQWGLKEYPRIRLKRDVIFGFTDLLVYVGGMAGLFLGCSVLSFAEIVYFFTIRLFWFVIECRKQNKV